MIDLNYCKFVFKTFNAGDVRHMLNYLKSLRYYTDHVYICDCPSVYYVTMFNEVKYDCVIEDPLIKDYDMYHRGFEYLPWEFKKLFLEEQVKQGNPESLNLFREHYCANAREGGFDWHESQMSDIFGALSNIINNEVSIEKLSELIINKATLAPADLLSWALHNNHAVLSSGGELAVTRGVEGNFTLTLKNNNYENQLQREETFVDRGSESTNNRICYKRNKAKIRVGSLSYRTVHY